MRRLGPTWLREMSTDQLHGLGLKLVAKWQGGGISPREDWLLDRISHELGWRMTKRLPSDRCSCSLCMAPWESYFAEPGPFDD